MLNNQADTTRVLFQAKGLFKTVKNLAKGMDIKPDALRKQLNAGKLDLNTAIQMSDKTGFSLESVSPSTTLSNAIIAAKRSDITIEIPIETIIVQDFPGLGLLPSDRPMIVGSDGVLISGLYQLELAKKRGLKKVKIILIDLERLYYSDDGFQKIHYGFLETEIFEIAHRFEKIIGHHPGLRNDLNPPSIKVEYPEVQKSTSKNNLKTLIVFKCNGKKDIKISKIIGLKPSYYYNGINILRHGIPELRDAFNFKEISASKAGGFSKLLPDEQAIALAAHLKGGKP